MLNLIDTLKQFEEKNYILFKQIHHESLFQYENIACSLLPILEEIEALSPKFDAVLVHGRSLIYGNFYLPILHCHFLS